MCDDKLNNGFTDIDDTIWGTSAQTPGLDSMKAVGNNKLMVVLFVVDCSRTMEGERIMAVNAALAEIKPILQDIRQNNNLDMKIAIMSFTSSAKWEIQLTDIDEVCLKTLQTRPGLTEYGTAFHELNKVLRKENYMKHTGKIAPPAIMFLTDGAPTDDYKADLDDLLKNGWFANASRSVVLVGDAIYDDAARKAVSGFVEDPDKEIVDAEKSSTIVQKMKLATLHTVAGNPISNTKDTANTSEGTGGSAGGNSSGGPFGDWIDGPGPFDDDPNAGKSSKGPFDDDLGGGNGSAGPFDDDLGGGNGSAGPFDDDLSGGNGSTGPFDDDLSGGNGSAGPFDDDWDDGNGAKSPFDDDLSDTSGAKSPFDDPSVDAHNAQ